MIISPASARVLSLTNEKRMETFWGILSGNFTESVNFIPKPSNMSLIPNKKNKKDTRPGGGGIGNTKPNQQNQKAKINTKGLSRNTKLTGGSQRGS
jgi:hypothetical protein